MEDPKTSGTTTPKLLIWLELRIPRISPCFRRFDADIGQPKKLNYRPINVTIIYGSFIWQGGRNMRFMKLALAIAALASLFPSALQAACRDILEQGIRNTYQNVKSGNLRSAYAQGFCNSYQQGNTSDEGGGVGISVPIEGVTFNLNGNYNSSRGNSIASSSCGNASSSLSDDDYEYLLRSTADAQ